MFEILIFYPKKFIFFNERPFPDIFSPHFSYFINLIIRNLLTPTFSKLSPTFFSFFIQSLRANLTNEVEQKKQNWEKNNFFFFS